MFCKVFCIFSEYLILTGTVHGETARAHASRRRIIGYLPGKAAVSRGVSRGPCAGSGGRFCIFARVEALIQPVFVLNERPAVLALLIL